jgi:hypothetical protein
MRFILAVLFIGAFPTFALPHDCGVLEQPATRIAFLENLIKKVTAEKAPSHRFRSLVFDDWSCISGGGCQHLSFQLMDRMMPQADVQIRNVMNVRNVLLTTGEEQESYAAHFFLVDQNEGTDDEIIIDPTYLQFFRNAETMNLPHIFVGTRKQLEAVFIAQANLIKPQGAPWLENVEPLHFVQLIYGYGVAEKDRLTSSRRRRFGSAAQ